MTNEETPKKKPGTWPAYMALARSGELGERAKALREMLTDCRMCPNECGVDRTAGPTGLCKAGAEVVVGAAEAHRGEEKCISGQGGSGTVFFTGCNLRCIHCQNFAISQQGEGETLGDEHLASVFIQIRNAGCHNLNLVTPTPWLASIVTALEQAVERGFRLPLVYNSSGFESLEMLDLLDGIVDIYLPDLKTSDGHIAKAYHRTGAYVDVARKAILRMQEQVGDLQLEESGVAMRGLIVRHLVLPGCAEDSIRTLAWLKENVSERVAVSLLTRYTPAFKAERHKTLSRPPSREEIGAVMQAAYGMGIRLV